MSHRLILGIVLVMCAIFSPATLRASGNPLEVGAVLPDVSGLNEKGEKVSLKTVGTKGYFLVYFYPMALTPGCTSQACSLRDAYAELQSKDVKIIGVSTDSVERQKKFQTEKQLPFPLIADTDQVVIKAFGVPLTLGKSARQAYLFKEGMLVWRDLKGSTSKQAEDILLYISSAQAKP